MADFSALKTAIQAYIRTNGNEEITGAILQDILLSMVSTMGDGAINALADALAAEVDARQNAVGGEATTRAEADSQLSGRINAEAQTRGEADTQLGNSITAITTRLNEGYVYAGIATPSTNPGTPAGKVFYIALQAGTYTNFSSLAVTQGINILKYNSTTWSLEQLVGIDDVPTKESNKLVKSGGVFANMGAFDISDYHKSGSTLATYADLTAALAALPSDFQKGGMSIKFVQSSDNKYVQYFLTKDEWSASKADWQKMNLEEEVSQLSQKLESTPIVVPSNYSAGYINSTGTVTESQNAVHSDFVEIEPCYHYFYETSKSTSAWSIGYYSSANESAFISAQLMPNSDTPIRVNLDIPAGATHFRITKRNFGSSDLNKATLLPDSVISYINDLQAQIDVINVSEINEEIDAIEEILTEEVVVNNLNPNYSQGYIGSDGTVVASSFGCYSDFVEIKSNLTYRFETVSATDWNIGYYSSANESAFISAQPLLSSYIEKVWQTCVIPTGAKYMRITRTWNNGNPNTLIIESYSELLQNRVKTYINDLQAQIDALKNNDGLTKQFAGIDKLGFVKNLSLFESDLMYIPMYGQSYTTENDGKYKITTEFDSNLFMHANGKPIGKGDTTLRQLATGENEEYIISDFAEVFSCLIKEYLYRTQDILVGSYGMGSRSVMELSKNNGYGSGYDVYETIFEPGVANAVAAATNANKSISCPFILYLQGESDTVEGDRTTAATPDSWCKGDKDMYKQSLLQLKNDMQQTIITATGQTVKPLFFVYTCGNENFNSSQSGIQQAVLELQQENDDFFVVGPYYYMTSMGAHLSPDGRRWLAELFAKQIFETIVHGEETTMKVESYSVSKTRLVLSVKTPQEPLQIDTHTCRQRTNYGFRLYHYSNGALGAEITISSVIINSSSIVLVTNEDLENIPVGGLFVTYGNTGAEGGGNICDSGKWRSYYNYASNNDGTGHIVYIPLDENGQSYVGKKYPMKTWMPQFGFSI